MCGYGLFSAVSGHPYRSHAEELTGVHRTDDHQNKDNYAVPAQVSGSPRG